MTLMRTEDSKPHFQPLSERTPRACANCNTPFDCHCPDCSACPDMECPDWCGTDNEEEVE